MPDCHVVTIASGGCNVLSYLTADPARITAVDLSLAHVALNRLKLVAASLLPSWEAFHRFFGAASDRAPHHRAAVLGLFPTGGLPPRPLTCSRMAPLSPRHWPAIGKSPWAVLTGLQRISPGATPG